MDMEAMALGSIAVSLGILVMASLAADFWIEQQRQRELDQMIYDLSSGTGDLQDISDADEIEITNTEANETLTAFIGSKQSSISKKIGSGKWIGAITTMVGGGIGFFLRFMSGSFIPNSMFPEMLRPFKFLLLIPMWAGVWYLVLDLLIRVGEVVIPDWL